jgi:hypothetical protein
MTCRISAASAFAFALLYFASAMMAQTSLAGGMSMGPGAFSSSGTLAGASAGLPLGQGAPLATPAKPKHPHKATQRRPKS